MKANQLETVLGLKALNLRSKWRFHGNGVFSVKQAERETLHDYRATESVNCP
jgi:hypothetical protein